MSEGRRLLSVFVAPNELFTDLGERPRWLVPFILSLVIVAVATLLPRVFVPFDVWMDSIRSSLLQVGLQFDEEYIRMLHAPVGNTIWALVASVALIFLPALAYWVVFSIVKSRVDFRKSLSVVTYSGLIPAVGSLLIAVLMVALQRLDITASLALLPFLVKGSFLYRFVAYIGFFAVWRVLVMGEGFSVIGEISRRKAFLVAILVWIAGFFSRELFRWILSLVVESLVPSPS